MIFFRIVDNTLYNSGEVDNLGFEESEGLRIPDEYLDEQKFTIMRMLHFVDAATTDELFISSDKISAMRVSDANTVLVRFQSLEDPTEATGDDVVTLTATAKSEVVAL